ncbi:MAG: SusC/RagA family TonB-linked outer membrane protein, partial [Candidatus Nephrothrix sp. EaCA]
MPLEGQTVVNLSMKQVSTQLDELVVTALNVKREAKSLGYAISTIKSAELVKSGNIVNPLMALYGKAAGVRIASTVNGPSGGMIVNIRNSVSLNEKSSTRPLFVVDGIPIYDQNTTSDDNPQT